MDLHVYLHLGDSLGSRIDAFGVQLARIDAATKNLLSQGNRTMATLQQIADDVAAETTAIGGLSTLIAGLQAQINTVPGIPAEAQTQIDAIFANVEANKSALAAAVATGVPVTQPPEEVPPVTDIPAVTTP